MSSPPSMTLRRVFAPPSASSISSPIRQPCDSKNPCSVATANGAALRTDVVE
jgi:hypothetical protein